MIYKFPDFSVLFCMFFQLLITCKVIKLAILNWLFSFNIKQKHCFHIPFTTFNGSIIFHWVHMSTFPF